MLIEGPEARGSNYYQDEGCEIAPSCLRCPLSVCIDDLPGRIKAAAYRWLRIRTLYESKTPEGDDWTLDQVAKHFGVARKTVLRALRPTARAILSWRLDSDREGIYPRPAYTPGNDPASPGADTEAEGASDDLPDVP